MVVVGGGLGGGEGGGGDGGGGNGGGDGGGGDGGGNGGGVEGGGEGGGLSHPYPRCEPSCRKVCVLVSSTPYDLPSVVVAVSMPPRWASVVSPVKVYAYASVSMGGRKYVKPKPEHDGEAMGALRWCAPFASV